MTRGARMRTTLSWMPAFRVSRPCLAASATTNETAFLTYKVVRSTGILAFDNQARV